MHLIEIWSQEQNTLQWEESGVVVKKQIPKMSSDKNVEDNKCIASACNYDDKV